MRETQAPNGSATPSVAVRAWGKAAPVPPGAVEASVEEPFLFNYHKESALSATFKMKQPMEAKLPSVVTELPG